jgi:hypothetical protein
MKWILVIMVLGTQPIQTQLEFENLALCLRTEEQIRTLYADEFANWVRWAKANPVEARYPASEAFMRNRTGLSNFGVCIPYKWKLE